MAVDDAVFALDAAAAVGRVVFALSLTKLAKVAVAAVAAARAGDVGFKGDAERAR